MPKRTSPLPQEVCHYIEPLDDVLRENSYSNISHSDFPLCCNVKLLYFLSSASQEQDNNVTVESGPERMEAQTSWY